MKKVFGIIIGIILTDLVLFPVALAALPQVNFKMLMAAVGLALFVGKSVKERKLQLNWSLFGLLIISCVMSILGFMSTVLNGTEDYVLATYVVSMLVWFFSAYAVIRFLYVIHGSTDIEIVGRYLVAVCAIQCILAILIENVPFVGNIVDNFFFCELIDPAEQRMMKRLYGLGCALDVAGIRFSCVEVILGYIIVSRSTKSNFGESLFYWTAMLLIIVVGNMIARTTTLGAVISLVFILIMIIKKHGADVPRPLIISFAAMIILASGTVLWLTLNFNNVHNLSHHLEFAFEGFFNWANTGSFETHSTDILQTMYRWPEELKTWLYGDGLWDVDGHFYMFTDVGYIRFIYYFGLPGLLTFIGLYIYATHSGIRLFPEARFLFYALFAVNMIVWGKVSTDTFVIFAILLNAGEQMLVTQEESIPEEDNIDAV